MAGPLTMKIAGSPRRLRAGRVWMGQLPRLIGVTLDPRGSQLKVNRLGRVRATFSQAMLASTITTSTFTLKHGATTVTTHVSYDATTKTATLIPSAPLLADTVYTAALTTSVQLANTTPITAVTWTFRTRISFQRKWFSGLDV